MMAVRSLPLSEQTPSLRCRMARSSQTEHNCSICGKPVDINTSKHDAISKAMHEECYVLRQMLKESTTPSNRPAA